MFEGRLRETKDYMYEKSQNVVNGLPNYYLELRKNMPIKASEYCHEEICGDNLRKVHFRNFTPGTVVVLRLVLFYSRKKDIF